MDRETSLKVIRESQRRPGSPINWFGLVMGAALAILAYIVLKITGVLGLFGF